MGKGEYKEFLEEAYDEFELKGDGRRNYDKATMNYEEEPFSMKSLENYVNKTKYLTICNASAAEVLAQHEELARQHDASMPPAEFTISAGPLLRSSKRAKRAQAAREKAAKDEWTPEATAAVEKVAAELEKTLTASGANIAKATAQALADGKKWFEKEKTSKWATRGPIGYISSDEEDSNESTVTLNDITATFEHRDLRSPGYFEKLNSGVGNEEDDEPIIHGLLSDDEVEDDEKPLTKKDKLLISLHPAVRNEHTADVLLKEYTPEQLARSQRTAESFAVPDDVRAEKTALLKSKYEAKLQDKVVKQEVKSNRAAKKERRWKARRHKRDASSQAVLMVAKWVFPFEALVGWMGAIVEARIRPAVILGVKDPEPPRLALAPEDARSADWKFPAEWMEEFADIEHASIPERLEKVKEAEKDNTRAEKLMKGSKHDQMLMQQYVIPTWKAMCAEKRAKEAGATGKKTSPAKPALKPGNAAYPEQERKDATVSFTSTIANSTDTPVQPPTARRHDAAQQTSFVAHYGADMTPARARALVNWYRAGNYEIISDLTYILTPAFFLHMEDDPFAPPVIVTEADAHAFFTPLINRAREEIKLKRDLEDLLASVTNNPDWRERNAAKFHEIVGGLTPAKARSYMAWIKKNKPEVPMERLNKPEFNAFMELDPHVPTPAYPISHSMGSQAFIYFLESKAIRIEKEGAAARFSNLLASVTRKPNWREECESRTNKILKDLTPAKARAYMDWIRLHKPGIEMEWLNNEDFNAYLETERDAPPLWPNSDEVGEQAFVFFLQAKAVRMERWGELIWGAARGEKDNGAVAPLLMQQGDACDSFRSTSTVKNEAVDKTAEATDMVTPEQTPSRAETSDSATRSFSSETPKLLSKNVDPAIQEQIEELNIYLNLLAREAAIRDRWPPRTFTYDNATWKSHVSILDSEDKREVNRDIFRLPKDSKAQLPHKDGDWYNTIPSKPFLAMPNRNNVIQPGTSGDIDWIRVMDEYRLGLNGRQRLQKPEWAKNYDLVRAQQPSYEVYLRKDLRFKEKGYFSDILPKPLRFPDIMDEMMSERDAAWVRHYLDQRIGLRAEDQYQLQKPGSSFGKRFGGGKPKKDIPKTAAQGRPPPKVLPQWFDTQAAAVMAVYQTLYEEYRRNNPEPRGIRGKRRMTRNMDTQDEQEQQDQEENVNLEERSDDELKTFANTAAASLAQTIAGLANGTFPDAQTGGGGPGSENCIPSNDSTKKMLGFKPKSGALGFPSTPATSSFPGVPSASATVRPSQTFEAESPPAAIAVDPEREPDERRPEMIGRAESVASKYTGMTTRTILDQLLGRMPETFISDTPSPSSGTSNAAFNRKLAGRREQVLTNMEERNAAHPPLPKIISDLLEIRERRLSQMALDKAGSAATSSEFAVHPALRQSKSGKKVETPTPMTPAKARALISWISAKKPGLDLVKVLGSRFMAHSEKDMDAEPVEVSDKEAHNFVKQVVKSKKQKIVAEKTVQQILHPESPSESLPQKTKTIRPINRGDPDIVSHFLKPSQVRAFVTYLEKNGHSNGEHREVMAYMELPDDAPPRKFTFTRREYGIFNQMVTEQRVFYEKRKRAHEEGRLGYAWELTAVTDPTLRREKRGRPKRGADKTARGRLDEETAGLQTTKAAASLAQNDSPSEMEDFHSQVEDQCVVLPKRLLSVKKNLGGMPGQYTKGTPPKIERNELSAVTSRKSSADTAEEEQPVEKSPSIASSEGAAGLYFALSNETTHQTPRRHARHVSASGPARDVKTAAKIAMERQKLAEQPSTPPGLSPVVAPSPESQVEMITRPKRPTLVSRATDKLKSAAKFDFRARKGSFLSGSYRSSPLVASTNIDDHSDVTPIASTVGPPILSRAKTNEAAAHQDDKKSRSQNFLRSETGARRPTFKNPFKSPSTSSWTTVASDASYSSQRSASSPMPATTPLILDADPSALVQIQAAGQQLAEQQVETDAIPTRKDRILRLLSSIDAAVEAAHAKALKKARKEKRQKVKLDAKNGIPAKPADLFHAYLYALDPEAKFKAIFFAEVDKEHLDHDDIKDVLALIDERDESAEADGEEVSLTEFYHIQEHAAQMQLLAEQCEYEGAMASVEAWRQAHAEYLNPNYHATLNVPAPKDQDIKDEAADGRSSNDSDDSEGVLHMDYPPNDDEIAVMGLKKLPLSEEMNEAADRVLKTNELKKLGSLGINLPNAGADPKTCAKPKSFFDADLLSDDEEASVVNEWQAAQRYNASSNLCSSSEGSQATNRARLMDNASAQSQASSTPSDETKKFKLKRWGSHFGRKSEDLWSPTPSQASLSPTPSSELRSIDTKSGTVSGLQRSASLFRRKETKRELQARKAEWEEAAEAKTKAEDQRLSRN